MPYNSVDELPANVKKFPMPMQKRFMEVFNSAFASCEKDGGKDCETLAFAQANAVVKKAMEMEAPVTGFLFTELSRDSLVAGRPFDGIAGGSFTDMYGRKLTLDSKDFLEFVTNTQALIDASKTESGELVGLPIDAANHDKGDAAGWIIAVELVGNIIRFTPKWTEKGIETILKGIRRFFSPTLNLSQKTALGGSLTNWPATRDQKGKVLLRPIELAEGVYTIAPAPTLESKILWAFRDLYPDLDLQSTESDHVIAATKEGQFFKVALATNDGIIFGERSTWTLVDLTFEDHLDQGDEPMPVTLSAEDQAAIVAAVVAAMPKPVPTPADDGNLSSILGLEGLSEDAKKARKVEIQGMLSNSRKQAELEYRAEMARLAHENTMTELSQHLTQGSQEAPRAYRVAVEELQTHLLKLDPDEAKFWSVFLSRTQKDGFVEMTELGTNRQPKGTHKLPEEVIRKLDSGEFKLTDLSNPILDLGELEQYDLVRWSK